MADSCWDCGYPDWDCHCREYREQRKKGEKKGFQEGLQKAARMASRRAAIYAPVEKCKDKALAWARQDSDLYAAYTSLAADYRKLAKEEPPKKRRRKSKRRRKKRK